MKKIKKSLIFELIKHKRCTMNLAFQKFKNMLNSTKTPGERTQKLNSNKGLCIFSPWNSWFQKCKNMLDTMSDPIWAYFRPTVNKRPTQVLFDPTPKRFFLTQREKMEKFDIFMWIFPIQKQNHKWLTRPEPQKIDPT